MAAQVLSIGSMQEREGDLRRRGRDAGDATGEGVLCGTYLTIRRVDLLMESRASLGMTRG